MKVRRAIKKIAALGVGAFMLGATLLSASAADLADFPKPLFINSDGTFSGKFVFGAQAGAEDVLGANAITAAVQAAAVLKTTVSSGGSVVTVSGDSAQIASSGDILEINERLGNVKAVLTKSDLDALKSGSITNQYGTSKYNQYLRFETNSTDQSASQVGTTEDWIDSGKVIWGQNDDDDAADFLYFQDGDAMFEYEYEFEEGLDSSETGARLDDWESRDFDILGKTFTLIKADNSTFNQLELTFLGGEWSQTMEEGEKTTVTIGDKDFDIEVLVIADTPGVVKFKINGETTDKLSEGETTVLSDGTTLGVREILPNEAGEEGMGDMVEFYIGANKIVWKDTDVSDLDFEQSTEVNDETVSGGYVMIKATIGATKATLQDIKYRLTADPKDGESDVLIPKDKGLRAYLDEDDGALGMLHTGWDIVYKGLSDEETTDFKIDASGDDKYTLDFTNVNGAEYTNIPFIDNSQGTYIIGKYRSAGNRVLHWKEWNVSDGNQYFIAKGDYFIVTSKNDTTGVTHVLKLDSVDATNKKVQFTDLALGTVEATYDDALQYNRGELILSGKSFIMYVNDTDENVSIDLNGDGTIATNSSSTINGKVSIVIRGGAIVELGSDKTTDKLVGADKMLVQFTTLAKQFDENGVINNTIGDPKSDWTTAEYNNEVIVINVTESTTANEVDLALVTGNANGLYPNSRLADNSVCVLKTLENIDDDKQQCITPYGAVVEYYNPTGSTSANTVTITYPIGQRQALVFVESGKTTTAKSGGGAIETETVVPIPSTASVLDIEVTNAKSQNVIIVGGPCANTAAQVVTGLPATFPECAAGVEAGMAIIKLLDSADGMAAGKVAMLVYGFNAKDTRLASQVVANYKDYATKFKGKELEVTGTSLTDVVIGAPVVQ